MNSIDFQKNVLLLFSIVIIGCNDSESSTQNNSSVESDSVEVDTVEHITIEQKETPSEQEIDLTDEELIEKWTWKEGVEIDFPEKSSIQHFTYPESLLLKKWKYPGDEDPILEFTPDSLNVFWDTYLYTLSHDSLWIYTKADHTGGVDRGIISMVTEDSLVIEWSTDDRNTYVSYP